MSHDGNLIGFGCLLDQGGGAAALRTLQIFKNHQGKLRSLRRAERRIGILRDSARCDEKKYKKK